MFNQGHGPVSMALPRKTVLGRVGVDLAVLGLALQLVAVARAAGAGWPSDPEGIEGQKQVRTFEGNARDREGKLVYTESHEVVYENDGVIASSRTEYRDPSGRLIATLISDYSRDRFVPDYAFEDLRSGKEEGLRWDGDQLFAYHRDAAGEELEEKRFDLREDMVGGQGFNNWVVERLDELAARESLTFRLLIPHRLDTVELRLRETDGPNSDRVLHLKGEIDNWFLRLIAPSVEMSYAKDTGRLVRYEGNSNLAADDGDSMWVQILYDYDTRVAGGVSAPEDS